MAHSFRVERFDQGFVLTLRVVVVVVVVVRSQGGWESSVSDHLMVDKPGRGRAGGGSR